MLYLKILVQIRLLDRLIGQTKLFKRPGQALNKTFDRLIGHT